MSETWIRPAAVGLLVLGVSLSGFRSGLLALACVGLALVIFLWDVSLPWRRRKRISFRLRYAHQHFEDFRKMDLEEDACVEIKPAIVLHRVFEEDKPIPLVPCVGNENKGWALRETSVFIEFITSGVRVTIGPDAKWHEGVPPEAKWQEGTAHKRYSYKFPNPIVTGHRSVRWPLEVVFLNFGMHEIQWTIVGEGIGEMKSKFFIYLNPRK